MLMNYIYIENVVVNSEYLSYLDILSHSGLKFEKKMQLWEAVLSASRAAKINLFLIEWLRRACGVKKKFQKMLILAQTCYCTIFPFLAH